jgi:phosphatidylglycerol lysyltransferase
MTAGAVTARAPRGGSHRWMRRLCAGVVLALGAVDLVGAAAVRPVVRAGFLGVDYAVAAVVGARYVLLAAGLAAVLTIRGLLHGKRAAWWVALVASVASLPGHHLHRADPAGMLNAVAAVVVLLAGRRAFVARADPALLRRGVAMLVAGELSVFGYAVVGLYELDEQFRRPTTVVSSVRDALRLLFLLPVAVEPVTRHGRFFIDSVRVAALAVAMLGLTWLVATVVGRPGHRADRVRVAQLLDRYATTALAHFHLLDDKNWVFDAQRRAFVGYTVVGTTAVALGEPVGDPGACREAARQFLQQCELNGWTPAFHQVTGPGRELLADLGLRTLMIGEEAIVDVRTWSIEGRENKSLRSAVRRCERAGYRIVDLPHPVDDATLARLREVSDAWLAGGRHRERTFSLGRFDAAYLRETPIVAVVDAAGAIEAFANVLPAYHGTDGSFDLMRRRPDAVNGVMDYLFVALITRFRDAGLAGMNLGLAPLSGAGTGTGTADRVIRLLYERGAAAFNFAGLRAFKDKWRPRWEPRYLAYRTDTELPKVALAVARAGELPDPRSPLARVLAVLHRFPVSAAFGTLQLWIMAGTALDPRLHTMLLRHFGLAWRDLARGQVWRLVTGPLIQAAPGFVWSNLLLLVVIMPVAEWRLGSRRVPVIFLIGDWISTLPVLIALRLAAAAGIGGAAAIMATRDAGSSSGAWALAAAVLCTLPSGRIRHTALAAMLTGMAVVLAIYRRMFDLQHLLSAAGTIILLHATRTAAAGDRARAPIAHTHADGVPHECGKKAAPRRE